MRGKLPPLLALASLPILLSAASCNGLKVESCIVVPEAHGSYCFDERKPKENQEYFKRLDEMDQYWCTNPEDAAEIARRLKQRAAYQ